MKKQSNLLIDIATRDVVCLSVEATLGEAARIMAQRRFSSIVVTDAERHPVGIVTERNILRAMSDGCSPDTSLQTGMSVPVIVMRGNTDCLEAYQTCTREGIRHLVLVDDGGAVAGVVSETDFRLHLNLTALAGMKQVSSVVRRTVRTLSPQNPLSQALSLMHAQRASCVVVVEDGKPVGIVTERDVVRLYSDNPQSISAPVAEVMTAPVLTISGEDTINRAAEQMLACKVRHLAVVDAGGMMLGLVGEHDLTQSMVAGLVDEKNRVDEMFLRSFIDSLPDLVWLKNADGVYLACNRRFERLFGAAAADIIGKTDDDFVDEKTADAFREHDREAMGAAQPCANEEWLTFAADGYRGLFETIKTPMRDSRGVLVGVLGVARDITRRKQTAQQLEEYRQKLEGLVVEESSKFRALVEQSLVGIFIIQDGFFRYVNRGLLNMFGFAAAEDVVGKVSIEQLVKPEYRQGLREIIQCMLDGGREAGRHTFTAHKADGTPIILDVHGRRIEYQGRPAIIGAQVDITEMRRSRDELERLVEEKSARLRQSEELLRTVIEAIPDAIQFKDGAGRWLEFNRAACAAFGLSESECAGKSDLQLSVQVDPRNKNALLKCAETDETTWRAGKLSRVEEILMSPDGGERTFDVIKQPLYDEDGSRKGLVIVGRDISELKRAEAGLRITASVFDNTQEAIVITDANNRFIDVNPAFTRITGYGREEVLGKNPALLSSGRQDEAFYEGMWRSLQERKVWRGEIWNRRKNGEFYAEMLSISAICDDAGKVVRHVGVFSDITYFKNHEAELSRAANFDALTGVPNRRLLSDRLSQAIVHAQRGGKLLAVCYIDLDGFKAVNDNHGHGVGDILLVEITRRLHEILRAGDTLARLGGDEFVVLFNDLTFEAECFQILDRIMRAISEPMLLSKHQITVSASIGVTFYPVDDEDGDTLMRHADQAMYLAKQTGKNCYHVYDPVNDQMVRSLHESRLRIGQGFDRSEFELYYQPKLELASNKVVGVEALIRWNHPQRGILQPADFLPLLENSELETRLGRWVMDSALEQLHAWEEAGMSLEISINIAARHLQMPDFVAELKHKLEKYPTLPLGRLQIEVLETAALEDMGQSAQVIEDCRKLGVSFALDDFGTGYSSLVYLRKLSADTLKIDQSFVQDMETNEADRAIVQGVIALAKTFGRKTVAEGMEDPKLLKILADMGCGYGQGYGIAHPMSATDFVHWYQKRLAK